MIKGDRLSCKHFVFSFTQSEGTLNLLNHTTYLVKVGLTFLRLFDMADLFPFLRFRNVKP